MTGLGNWPALGGPLGVQLNYPQEPIGVCKVSFEMRTQVGSLTSPERDDIEVGEGVVVVFI